MRWIFLYNYLVNSEDVSELNTNMYRLPNLLINRLFLNIRSWHLPQTYQDSKHVFAKAELPLTHSEGSIGAPLRDSNWYSLNFRNDGHNLESHVMGFEEGSETIMLTRADGYWTSMVPVVSESCLRDL